MCPIKKGDLATLERSGSGRHHGSDEDQDEMEEEKDFHRGSEDEDEEEDEENAEEFKDFIVGDDEVEEEDEDDFHGYARSDNGDEGEKEEDQESRRKKHRKKKRDIKLDEEDLELIQENEGYEGRVHKKLKKTKEIARRRDSEDYAKEQDMEEERSDFIEKDNFIEGDEEEEEYERKRKPSRKGDHYNILSQVFGQGFEPSEEDEEYGEGDERRIEEEDEDLPPEEKRARLKKKYERLFDPGELQDKFATFDDEQIINEDMPERLQIRYKNRFCDNNELVQETNWIADKLMMSKGLIDKNSDNFRKNIMKVLEFLRINFCEIMYIHTYKANEISLKPGELKLQDLWKIYDYDVDWTSVWSKRKLVEKNFEKMSTYMHIPDLVLQLFNVSFDKFNLDNLLDYCEFQTLLHPEVQDRLTITENKPFKKSTRVYIKPELKERFDDFATKYLLPSDKFSENLYEGKIKYNSPYIEELLTDVTQRFYVDENIPKLSNSQSFLNQLCDYIAHDLFYNPIIRKLVYRQYFEKILLSTEPTQKGKKEIDMYNINYCVKRIDSRPLKDLDNEIWLRAVQNEKEGKIKIKFHFRWKEMNTDEISTHLKNLYLYDSKIKNEATSQWNILRTEILTILLRDFMYPFMEKVIRKDLSENAEKALIQDCGRKFKEMISAAPYTKSDGDDVVSDIKVMSLIPEESNKVTCAIVDIYGEYIDHKTFSYLLVNERKAPIEYINKQSLEEEDLKKFVERYTPDLLVVGADNLSAKSLVKYLRDQSQKWSEEVKNVWIKYGDMAAPKIYAKMDISRKELPSHPQKLKEAISLARLQQSPLHEILKLWHHRKEENGILHIIFHDLQNFLNTEKLVQELEKSAIEVTNQVGLDLNKILRHEHLSHPFQFLSGLGPRKAKTILETLNQKMIQVVSRRELAENKVVGKNVFTNLAGFIKVGSEKDFDDTEQGRDLLDATRIHPNDYRLAQKIAKDALDDVDHGQDYIKTIMEKPQKLDELDLDDYATHLETKGKTNMKIVLDFIVNELTRPFADPRGAHREMDHKELFYKMTKMHPFELQNGSLVNARVTRVTDKNIICRLECGIEGNVFAPDVFEAKDTQQTLKSKFKEGQVVTARVGSANFDEKSKRKEGGDNENKTIDFTKLHLYLKSSAVNGHEKYLKELHPSCAQTFRILPDEDFPVTQQTTAKQVRYYTRKINHPKFKNASAQVALGYLEDKEIGDYVVRPSSKGMDHLTLTWKFYQNIYVHLDIREAGKGPGDRIGKRLIMKDQVYESIDELAAGYVNPCNSFVKNILQNPKFLNDNPNRIEELIKQEKEENPKLIPYRFGFSTEAPQFLILYYAPKDYNVIKEYIKVKPNGLHFHANVFQNLSQLVSWFKQSYHKPDYHKYLKLVKPPVALPKTNTQVKGEKAEPSSFSHGANTPTHLGRAFDNDIKVKQERGEFYVKQEKGINNEDNRGYGYNRDRGDRDRDFNRNSRGGRPYNNQDRGKFNRDFDNRGDRPPRRDRSRSREKERERERSRDFRGDRGNERFNNRDNRDNRERSNYDRNQGGRGRDYQDNRRKDSRDDRRDSGKGFGKKEGGWGSESAWGSNNASAGWSNNPTSGGWGTAMAEERTEGGWADENKGGNAWGDSQAINVKSELKTTNQETGGWGDEPSNAPKIKQEAVGKVKEEGGWGTDVSGGW